MLRREDESFNGWAGHYAKKNMPPWSYRIFYPGAGLTQRELSDRTGIPQPAIARIERGGVSPTVATLDRLLAGTGQAIELSTRLGSGVDRTLIRAALAMSPEARVAKAGSAGRNLVAFRRAAREGRRDGPRA